MPASKWVIFWYFTFRSLPAFVAGGAIYLGYRLFILGVTGQASLSVRTATIEGQLLNATPGFLLASGGLLVLLVMAFKGLKAEKIFNERSNDDS